MNKEKCVAWFICDISSKTTLSAHSFTILKLKENFDNFFIINLHHLKYPNKYKNINNQSNTEIDKETNVTTFKPKNFTELKNFTNNKNILGIINFGVRYSDIKLHFLLNFLKIKFFQISNIGGSSWSFNTEKELSVFKRLKFKFGRFSYYLIILLSNLKILPKTEVKFLSNLKIINAIKNSSIKKFLFKLNLFYSKKLELINSRSYDISILNEFEVKEDNIVLLDLQLDHEDDKKIGHKNTKEKTLKHYEKLNEILSRLSKIFNKPVVVTIHPTDDLNKKKEIFPEYEVVKYNTVENIYKGFLILFFDSTAIIDAFILKKKIITIKSKFTGQLPKDGSDKYKNEAGVLQINLDSEISKENILDKEIFIEKLNNNIKYYDEYIKQTIAPDGSEPGYKKIVRVMNNYF